MVKLLSSVHTSTEHKARSTEHERKVKWELGHCLNYTWAEHGARTSSTEHERGVEKRGTDERVEFLRVQLCFIFLLYAMGISETKSLIFDLSVEVWTKIPTFSVLSVRALCLCPVSVLLDSVYSLAKYERGFNPLKQKQTSSILFLWLSINLI